jgi:hypothetical protein
MPEIEIIKTNTSPSVSGKSKLTYSIGTDHNATVYLRVEKNSGGGFFSDAWITLEAIETALADQPEGITAAHLVPLYKAKSVNSPGYLLAVLRHEALIAPLEGKSRRFRWQGTSKFLGSLKIKTKRR